MPFVAFASSARAVFCIAAGAALALAAHPAPAAAAVSSAPVARTHDGPVQGTTTQGMDEFLGIPYAAPPVGRLRWRPPQRHAPWTQPIVATQFANHCPQPATPFGMASTTEDCLYLNVFAPKGTAPGAKLPVMFWIHGGGLETGESNDYDPDRLVRRGVVAVTINYRLGLLGFFAQPGIDKEPHTLANYGLMDQQAALSWIRSNAAAFGGDPSRIMIFGESAGGISVLSQLASPTASGLFQRALVESGSYQVVLPSLASAEGAGAGIANNIGCSNQSAACLRRVSVAKLLQNEPSQANSFLPIVDGTILPESFQTAFPSGHFNRVPVVDGTNHDEFRLFVALDFDLMGAPVNSGDYSFLVETLVGSAAAPKVLAAYPLSAYASPDLAFAALGTDGLFSCNAHELDHWISHYTATYAYEFADENAPEDFLPPVSFPYGAAHASELQFLFDDFFLQRPPLTPGEETLRANMIGAWTRFATNGSPNGPNAPVWQAYVPGIDDVESLVPPQPVASTTFAQDHKCALWHSLATGADALPRLNATRAMRW